MNWTPLEKLMVGLPVVAILVLVGWRGYGEIELEQRANEMARNATAIAGAMAHYHAKTGRWFPLASSAEGVPRQVRLVIDIFYGTDTEYQGLDPEWLWREYNSGMALQIVRFDPAFSNLPEHTFENPFEPNEPYLRVLLDYGERFDVETEILSRLERRLPEQSIAEIDSHYYVIDLRRLMNVDAS